jgi:DNA-binding MarR family transcriptional regulator
MRLEQKAERMGELCQSIIEFRYKLRRMFAQKLKDAGIDISFEVLEIMRILMKQENVNQQDLADMLFKDKSNLTYLIDNMVKAGWAVRQEDVKDRRNKLIKLTDKAWRLQEQLAPLSTNSFLDLAKNLNDEEVESGIKLLTMMNQSAAEATT